MIEDKFVVFDMPGCEKSWLIFGKKDIGYLKSVICYFPAGPVMSINYINSKSTWNEEDGWNTFRRITEHDLEVLAKCINTYEIKDVKICKQLIREMMEWHCSR